MKGMHILCASQASTAICLQMDPSSSSSSTAQLGGRAIDRHNPIIRDGRRVRAALPNPPCSSQEPPINPKPYHQLQKTKKSSSKSKPKPSDTQKKRSSNAKPSPSVDQKKKSVAEVETEIEDVIVVNKNIVSMPSGESMRRSFVRQSDLFTPPGSTRYLLSDAPSFDGLSDYDPVLSLPPPKNTVTQDRSSVVVPQSKPPPDQVVVLRVSLHCKGCEGKVRKHLSRMKGVTSFNIDYAAKKVTVTGDVTPVSVLASVSKVKSAQFWAIPPASGASSKVETKK